jgi:hypothetical protein
MIERFSVAPWSFWLHLLVLAILVIEGLKKWHHPWAKPALAVYGTVAFWYTGDFLLSNQMGFQAFTDEVVALAFLQVALFLAVFRATMGHFARGFCKTPLQDRRRQVYRRPGLATEEISPRLLRFLLALLIIGWIGIFSVGVSHAKSAWPGLIWPPLNLTKAGMYPLTGLGSGYSFFFNALSYIHVLICSLFGVVAVMGRGPVRWIAVTMVLVTWPYFWFDRTRNKMLALLLPGLAAFLLLGKRAAWLRIAVLLLSAAGVITWFGKVEDFRSQKDLAVFLEEATTEDDDSGPRRSNPVLGQDMLKELCWVNTFIESGRYHPNWGRRYFAEIVNPIPRALWPGKPTVGIDYAIARGFGGAKTEHGVWASVATGMIGQGCVNFGRFFGVVAAAILYALWAAFLARLWCQRASPFRLALFLIGLGLTLNTGRDLTFLVLFPFAFGFLALKIYERFQRPPRKEWRPTRTVAVTPEPRSVQPPES